MLKISYDDQKQQALLATESPSALWIDVRRVCEERFDEVERISNCSLLIPWWAFLAIRQNLNVILEKHNEDIEVDSKTEKLLRTARAKEDVLDGTTETPQLAEGELLERLLNQGFARELTFEQKRNIRKLLALSAGATFSVPGAGKTTEALAYFVLRGNGNSKLLVVAPKNAFAAWEEQLEKCLPAYPHRFFRLTGGIAAVAQALAGEQQLFLITYQQFAIARDIIASYLEGNNSIVFLDESHKIKKGLSGVIGNSVLSISHLPSSKLILSGTPMPNSIEDLIPQVGFLYPELDLDIADLKDRMKPLYVRTTKSELRLPPVRRMLVPVQMKPNQRRLYNLIRSEVTRDAEACLNSSDRNRLRSFGKSVLRLLQVTSNPALLLNSTSFDDAALSAVLSEGDSPKLEYACMRARQLANQHHKSIIWSIFVDNVELIATRLRDLGADFIHGGVETGSEFEDDTREAKIRRFHTDPNAFVLVANPAACAEGISLHEVCHHAIYLDRSYNAAQYLQSEDRIHRLGLPPDAQTNVEIVICKDSVDESVNRRILAKVGAMARILDDPSLNVDPLDLDIESDRIDLDDITDLLSHLKETR